MVILFAGVQMVYILQALFLVQVLIPGFLLKRHADNYNRHRLEHFCSVSHGQGQWHQSKKAVDIGDKNRAQ